MNWFLFLCSIAGLLSSTVYLILTLEAARRFRAAPQRLPQEAHSWPMVTVLKPLHGMEPQLERNLESFFLLEYPTFELIFGVRNVDDPAVAIVDSLQRKYPNIQTKMVFSGEPEYPNAKVFSLEKMIAVASGSYFVITDSDVFVRTDCLEQVIGPLLDPAVGVVTCLYRGVPAGGFWSTLEALGMSIEMPSGVLVAKMLEGMKFALGPTMATRKDVLQAIGGIAALGSYCADDYALGHFAHRLGKEVVLSQHVIDHIATNTTFRSSLAHQVRWMRSTRFSRGAGHVGTGLTYAVPFGLIACFTAYSIYGWQTSLVFLIWALINRVIQALVIGWKVIGDQRSLQFCWLYPARDLMGFFVWCASFWGSEIVWRKERYQLIADGKMVRKSL